MVAKTRNGVFHPVLFRVICPEAKQYDSVDPQNFDSGTRNTKSDSFVNNREIRSVPFRFVPLHCRPKEVSPFAEIGIMRDL